MIRRKDIVEKTYTDIRFRIALHLLFWVLLLASYYYFNTISFNPAKGTPATYLLAVHNAVTIAAAYYSLMYFIWPRFFARKRWGTGILVFVGWVIAIATLVSWGDWLIFNRCASCGERLAIYNPDYYQFLQRGLPNIVFVRVLTGGLLYQLVIQLGFPVAIKIGRSYFRQAVQQLELAKDNLQLEFNFLKSQVNPHFLFNTLNNIYALVASQRNEQATATIAQLSGILRYTLYETGDEKILLEKEVQLLKDYVELEKLRLNETVVQLNFDTDSSHYTIPPLLFLPAIENAFKYTPDEKESTITIAIKAVKGHLHVSIANAHKEVADRKPGGIGLQNMARRLQHSFGNKASVSASATNGVYLFQLSCPLS
ncbi:sensor histidine kinase [Flavisolibacter sp. BT320]|nr:sensor histidine kinase [Flavisolibacter longurius]